MLSYRSTYLPNLASRIWCGLALICGLALSACDAEPIERQRIHPESFTAADEAKIASRLFAASWRNENIALIEPDSDSFTDAAYDYLRPLVNEIVAREQLSRRDSFAWDIHLVLDTAVHAYALPGGQLVVHTGLLHALDDEAACVGILAREIAIVELGMAMAAYDRAVEDNTDLGDLILGNPTDALGELIRLAPTVTYTDVELARVDSLTVQLVCGYEHWAAALPQAVGQFTKGSLYSRARPARNSWRQTFVSRVSECNGPDSLYADRYRAMLRKSVPK